MMIHLLLILRDRVRHVVSIWLSKLAKFIGPLALLLSSTQLGLHFWPQSALILGIRQDYLSLVVYLLDLFVLAGLTYTWISRRSITPQWELIVFAASALLFATYPIQSLVYLLRVYIYLQLILNHPFRLITHIKLFVLWIILLLSLACLQIWSGGSLQGIFYWLGERRFSLGDPGIAHQTWFNTLYLRAYSTFSHPNVFSGWIVLVVVLFLRTLPSLLRPILIPLALFGAILGASRSALLGLALGLGATRYSLALVLLIFPVLYLVRPESVLLPRLELISQSFSSVASSPLFGYGVFGNLANSRPGPGALRLFEPDHFGPTLLLSWFGIVGVLQLLLIVSPHLRTKVSILSSLSWLLPLLPPLILDHYLFTSPSGLYLGLFYLLLTSPSRRLLYY